MLNKELSHFSESSKSGNQISEYICSTFLGKRYSWRAKCSDIEIIQIIFPDKQQELDIPSLRIDDGVEIKVKSKKNEPPPRHGPGSTMSQIHGVNRRPLCHTNSFTGEKLPLYGVDTPFEDELGKVISKNHFAAEYTKMEII